MRDTPILASLLSRIPSAQTERDKSFYESKCATLDRQIDSLVYELYDLTPEEIAIVEGK